MIKALCISLKALITWKLPLQTNSKTVLNIFKDLVKIYDWLEADSVLFNCFLSFLQNISVMEVGRHCMMEQIHGKPLLKIILKKIQAFSTKPPHTEMNLTMLKNGLQALKTFSVRVDVRMALKNEKVFEILELFHPQIHCTRKSTWDDVTTEWLRFLEFLSRFEDIECLP